MTTLDTRGIPAAEVAWTAGTVAPNSRRYGIRLQYRTDIDGQWPDMPGDDGLPAAFNRSGVAGDERRMDDLFVRVPPQLAGTDPMWVAAHFAAGDPLREPGAAVADDGVTNLFRHAHGLAPGDAGHPARPHLSEDAAAFSFRHDPSQRDIVWIVRGSEDLTDWPVAWFDSRFDADPPADADGWVSVPLPQPQGRRMFARLELLLLAPQP